MDSLQSERLRRLHRQFLDAADHFPDLRFAAITIVNEPEWLEAEVRWPCIALDRERYLGLPATDWRELLSKPPGTPFCPIKTVWLRIDGHLWEGAYFNGGGLRDPLEDQFENLKEGIVEFERLAGIAAGNFEMLPSPNAIIDFPLKPEATHRWLEALGGRPFVLVKDAEGYELVKDTDEYGRMVREVPGDLFTASAWAVEELGQSPQESVGAKPAQGTGGSKVQSVGDLLDLARDGSSDTVVPLPSSPPSQPEVASKGKRETILRQLSPAFRKAYLSYQYAETKAEKRLEDHEAYHLLQDEGIPTNQDDLGELTDYELPSLETWARQIREARRLLGEQKNTPRKGRPTGRSIVSGREIENQRGGDR